MTDHQQRRSKFNLVVNGRFQWRIVLFILLAGVLTVGVTANLCYAYVVDSYDFILQHSSLPEGLIDERYHDLYIFLASLSAVNLGVVAVVAAWALFVTHRAAGAVYHVRRVIDDIRAGRADARVHLRKKDEFQELARSFNALMDELQLK